MKHNMNQNHTPGRLSLMAIAVAAFTLPASSTFAQGVLEEVVVTATKRAESTQDIAISVVALSGDRLNKMSIDNFENMAISVPNFSVSDSLTVSQITMRGVGSGEDRGFEQSVSTYKDGVYLPRSRQSRSPFFDVDRVEVLRGPQAVLFGLNSTAGAVSVHGAVNNPGDEFELSLTGEYEAEYSGMRVRAVAGGSVGETLGWRLALETKDSGDGWLENNVSGDAGVLEHDMARLSLVWQPTDQMKATFRWEHNEAESTGQITEIVNANTLATDAAPGGLFDRVAGVNAAEPGTFDLRGLDGQFDGRSFASENIPFKALHDSINGGNYRLPLGADQEIDNVSLALDWALGEYTLSALLGYSDYSYDAAVNIAGLPFSIYSGTNFEEYDQTSIEIRLASPAGEAFEWIAGVYYQDSSLFTDQPNTIDVTPLLSLVTGLPPAVVDAAVTGAPPLWELAGANLAQDAELMSLFVNGTWNINESVSVTAGVRYSDDEKKYVRSAQTTGSGLYLKAADGGLGTFIGGAVLNANGLSVGDTAGIISSDNLMPELSVEWDVNDDVMLYAKYAQSVKSGGVATAGSAALDGLIYGDEDAESFEVGMKGRFLGGRAELNAAIFTTEFTDLQVKSSIVDGAGAIATIIGNAGAATSEGLELDGRVLISDGLTLGANIAFLNAEYDFYPAGPCNRSGSTTPGAVAGTCYLSGEQLPFAVETSGS
ncbi:MAG: TonB-dependent receptor, partial [Pseudomonadales bacterium]